MNTVYEPPKTDVRQTHETYDPPLFSSKGRVGRLRYIAHLIWLTAFVYLVGAIAGLFLVGAVGDVIALLALVATIVIQIIFAIKRCHDFNASGWWSVLTIIPLVGLVYAFIPGTPGENRFGPPPSPNTRAIIAGAMVLPLIFIGGVLAAIFIPAYQDYGQRAQIGTAFEATAPTKTAIARFVQETRNWPSATDLDELGIGGTIEARYSRHTVEPGTGTIVVTMREDGDIGPDIAGGQIVFRPQITDTFEFVCSSDDIAPKFLPLSCQEN